MSYTACSFCPCSADYVDEDQAQREYLSVGYLHDWQDNPVCNDCYNRVDFYVNVYSIGQGYGGAEEGGWWFTCGEPVASVPVKDWDEAEDVRAVFREQFPSTGKSSSVLGSEDYSVVIERHFARPFPDSRPHYE